ncbi:MAG: hypothetical protein JWP08_2774, partial [Bryobacterales bacterium]|nr:hypothetical protein [Bryobacterales bacterium]
MTTFDSLVDATILMSLGLALLALGRSPSSCGKASYLRDHSLLDRLAASGESLSVTPIASTLHSHSSC